MKKLSVLALSLLSIGLSYSAPSSAEDLMNDPATFEFYAGPKPIAGTYCKDGAPFLKVEPSREITLYTKIVSYANWGFSLTPTFVRRIDYDASTKTYKAPGRVEFYCGGTSVYLPVRFEGDFEGDLAYVSIFGPSSLQSGGCAPATNSTDAWYSWDFKLIRGTLNAKKEVVCPK